MEENEDFRSMEEKSDNELRLIREHVYRYVPVEHQQRATLADHELRKRAVRSAKKMVRKFLRNECSSLDLEDGIESIVKKF